jgi:hypothetical protein
MRAVGPAKGSALARIGVDHVLIDDGNVADQVAKLIVTT